MQSGWKYKAIHLSWEIRRRHNTGKVRTWDAWEHIRRLTCLVCGVRYVRQLEGNPDAERICDEICQKIYDLRISVGEKNGH